MDLAPSPDAVFEAPSEDAVVYVTADAAEGNASYQACIRVR